MAKRHGKLGKRGGSGKQTVAFAKQEAATPPFRRVLIKGILVLKSELHIGSGVVEPVKGDSKRRINQVERDVTGAPYLPASGLRGVLAAQLEEAAHPSMFRRIFGRARQATDREPETTDKGGMGLLRVFDGHFVSDKSSHTRTRTRTRTRIEPVTGTAMQHHLATHELVPEGSQFQLRLMMDHSRTADEGITEDELQCVLGLLNGLNHQSLGAGKSIGQGAVKWQCQSVEVISEKDYRSWLLSNLQRAANSPSKVHIKELNTYLKSFDNTANDSFVTPQSWQRQGFFLHPNAPILINDAESVEKEKKEEKRKKEAGVEVKPEDKVPDSLLMMREHNGQKQAVIPGSTQKGWFRAQARRILLTLTQGERAEVVDKLLGDLFGSVESGMSLLRFEDAWVKFDETNEHVQMFNAVDRFTGGAKDGALFKAKALCTSKFFSGGISYQGERLCGWMRILLLYIWQDAKDGDLVLGWGKVKGYGRLQLLAEDDDMPGWLEKPDTARFESWQEELLTKLNTEELGHE